LKSNGGTGAVGNQKKQGRLGGSGVGKENMENSSLSKLPKPLEGNLREGSCVPQTDGGEIQ